MGRLPPLPRLAVISEPDILVVMLAIPRALSGHPRARQLEWVGMVCVTCFAPAMLLTLTERQKPAAVLLHERFTADPAGLVRELHARTASPVVLLGRPGCEMFGADAALTDNGSLAPQIAGLLPGLLAARAGYSGCIRWGQLSLHEASRRAYWQGDEIKVTKLQFRLLWRMCRAHGALVTAEELSLAIYGDLYPTDAARVVAHVRRIRQVLEPDPSRPTFLLTVRGEGFRLAD
jgi:hypothetical protein